MGKNTYIQQFSNSLNEIEELINTPEAIREYAIQSISQLIQGEDLTNTGGRKVSNIKRGLENISDKSIKKHYQIIYNQVCVLAVSSLSVILEKLFIELMQKNPSQSWVTDSDKSKKIKISIAEMQKYNYDVKNNLGQIIVKKDDSINFQDLNAILRTFAHYLQKKIKLNSETRDSIIFYQQCRHIIVHKNGIIDQEFINKTKSTQYNKRYSTGDKIQLNKDDWKVIKKSFKLFLGQID